MWLSLIRFLYARSSQVLKANQANFGPAFWWGFFYDAIPRAWMKAAPVTHFVSQAY
ncbi:hypothetical protein GGQ73_003798 [Rhizobium skierniewicense]|uniref:Uncharacterized protein n=1 Tax=Rhizobium skierniewicense TaxID=984260 RepID=A0A7W6G3F8_9HYPH|nr:hypothetical protein [Rhizobium skierniewicense]